MKTINFEQFLSGHFVKSPLRLMLLICVVFAFSTFGQISEKTVALKVSAEKPARYLSITKSGGLSIESSKISSLQVFVLIDTNGGELADGDDVQIKHVGKNGKFFKYLFESEGTVSRTSKSDQSTHFKVKKSGAGISLKTAGGKYLSANSITDPLAFTDSAEKALVFEIVENPTAGSAK